MKFLVEIKVPLHDENLSEWNFVDIIEAALDEYGYSARVKLVEEKDEI